MKTITMREIFNALVRELGFDKGRDVFEWYCETYQVNIGSDVPPRIRHEVLGI